MKPSPYVIGLAAGALGLTLLGVYVWHRGIGGAAADLGKGAVNAAGGAAKGVVNGVSGAVGLPTTDQTTTDPAVARWVIDHYGYYEASKWAGAPALLKGWWMEAGTGTAPAATSDLARYLATIPALPAAAASATVTDDETDRLLKRYPAPDPVNSYEAGGYAYGA